MANKRVRIASKTSSKKSRTGITESQKKNFLEESQMYVASKRQIRESRMIRAAIQEEDELETSDVVICPACGAECENVGGEETVFVCPSCDNSFELINTDFVDALAGTDDDSVTVAVIDADEDGDLQAVVLDLEPEVDVEEVIDAVDSIDVDGAEGAVASVVSADDETGEDDGEVIEDDGLEEELPESRKRVRRRTRVVKEGNRRRATKRTRARR